MGSHFISANSILSRKITQTFQKSKIPIFLNFIRFILGILRFCQFLQFCHRNFPILSIFPAFCLQILLRFSFYRIHILSRKSKARIRFPFYRIPILSRMYCTLVPVVCKVDKKNRVCRRNRFWVGWRASRQKE